MAKLDRIAPGEILLEEFLLPLGISQNQLARDLGVPVSGWQASSRVIVPSPPTQPLRLSQYFGTTADMWMTMQIRYDLKLATRTTWPKVRPRIRTYKAASSA